MIYKTYELSLSWNVSNYAIISLFEACRDDRKYYNYRSGSISTEFQKIKSRVIDEICGNDHLYNLYKDLIFHSNQNSNGLSCWKFPRLSGSMRANQRAKCNDSLSFNIKLKEKLSKDNFE